LINGPLWTPTLIDQALLQEKWPHYSKEGLADPHVFLKHLVYLCFATLKYCHCVTSNLLKQYNKEKAFLKKEHGEKMFISKANYYTSTKFYIAKKIMKRVLQLDHRGQKNLK
jgi:hypothetical protein